MELNREPLSSPAHLTFKGVVIVGVQTNLVAHLIQVLKKILAVLRNQVFIDKTLEELDDRIMNARAAIICLVDLDKQAFQDITSDKWYGFGNLFVCEKVGPVVHQRPA